MQAAIPINGESRFDGFFDSPQMSPLGIENGLVLPRPIRVSRIWRSQNKTPQTVS